MENDSCELGATDQQIAGMVFKYGVESGFEFGGIAWRQVKGKGIDLRMKKPQPLGKSYPQIA